MPRNSTVSISKVSPPLWPRCSFCRWGAVSLILWSSIPKQKGTWPPSRLFSLSLGIWWSSRSSWRSLTSTITKRGLGTWMIWGNTKKLLSKIYKGKFLLGLWTILRITWMWTMAIWRSLWRSSKVVWLFSEESKLETAILTAELKYSNKLFFDREQTSRINSFRKGSKKLT